MTPDEVRMLDNQYAIVFIRGERPILDYKYDILSHPNVSLSADGEGERYDHGELPDIGYGVEVVDIATYPGMKMSDFLLLDEYYTDFYAYDEEETAALLEFLKTELESKEDEKQKN